MALEKAREFLESFEQNKQALDMLREKEGTADKETAVTEVANALGFEVTKEEIAQATEEILRERAAENEAAAGKIKELTLEEMDQAAGGRWYFRDVCSESFVHRENCFFDDSCSMVINGYETKIWCVNTEYQKTEARCSRTVKTKEWKECT